VTGTSERSDPLLVAEQVARELAQAGAEAVVLAGSHARGDASPRSDLDLYAIGDGPAYQLRQQNEYLVSVSWRTLEEERRGFHHPGRCGAMVPGWRSAIVLHDPAGIAAELIELAHRWNWQEIGDEHINALVAEELTGLAEEVHKLVAALEQGRLTMAAVQRSVLALRIPVIMATHLRLLYDSENVLWDLVAGGLGPEWARTQSTALGLAERPVQETCHAALMMFEEACRIVSVLFDDRQRAIVDVALTTGRSLSPAINSNSVVVVLVEQEGRFLMIEEADDNGNLAWYFPAGSVEPGESLAEAARREVYEETGWLVDPSHLLRFDHGYFRNSSGVQWWRHVVVARPRPGAITAAPEDSILNVEWLAVGDLAGLTLRGDDAEDLLRRFANDGPGLDLADYRFSPDGTLSGFYH